MRYKLFFFCLAECLFSCSPTNETDSTFLATTVEVPMHRDETIDNKQINLLKASFIQVQDNYPVGDVRDVGIIDSICYVVDSNRNIYGINLSKRQICYRYTNHGGAKLETIFPACIATDNEHVYVYDTGKSQVLVLSSQLVPEKAIRMPNIVPFCFKKTDKGFLCLSISAGVQEIVYVDDRGMVKYNKILSCRNMDVYDDNILIQQGEDGYLYAKAMYSDSIYKWSGSKLDLVLTLDYGDHSIPKGMNDTKDIENTKREYTSDFFVFKHGILNSFIEQSKQYKCYNYYEYNANGSIAGNIKSIFSLPFIPRWQFGSVMLFVCQPEYIYGLKSILKKEADVELRNEGLVIIKYDLS